MTRLEKCELLKSKGYTYDAETGKIYGKKGKEIVRKSKNGYIYINIGSGLFGHHFAWYMSGKDMDFIELDHKDTNRTNNCIDNLRISNRTQQTQNTNAKGYYMKKNRWAAQIQVNKKQMYLGSFKTEEEARETYLKAKRLYHIN